MKIDIDEIPQILLSLKVDQKTVQQVADKLREVAEDNAAEAGPKGPKSKYKYLVVASDPDNLYPQLENIPMWVFKVKDEEKHTDVLPRFFKGVYDFNAKSRKGKKNPIKSVGDGIQTVGPKFFKPEKSPILTKNPVIVLKTDNKIPS